VFSKIYFLNKTKRV